MMRWLDAVKLSDLETGHCLSLELENKYGIALFNVDGQIYALENLCPHAGGPIGDGILEDNVIACPWHGWKFNVCTGQRLKNPSAEWTISSYPVRIEEGMIQVAVPEE